MKKTSDNSIKFLIECGWEYTEGVGFSHSKLTEEGIFLVMSGAILAQENYDPGSTEELDLINNLNTKQVSMYADYLDS